VKCHTAQKKTAWKEGTNVDIAKKLQVKIVQVQGIFHRSLFRLENICDMMTWLSFILVFLITKLVLHFMRRF